MVHHAGELAYYDSFLGLIPCKVISVTEQIITVRITANRKGFYKGEIISKRPGIASIVPRSNVHTRAGMYRINCQFCWVN